MSRNPCQLDLGAAAVDKEFDPVDEAAVLASQEDHGFGDFVGFPYPSQRNLGGLRLDESPKLLIVQTEQIVARSRHDARADRVNANPFVLEIQRPVPSAGGP
jgi:hypothetical protein